MNDPGVGHRLPPFSAGLPAGVELPGADALIHRVPINELGLHRFLRLVFSFSLDIQGDDIFICPLSLKLQRSIRPINLPVPDKPAQGLKKFTSDAG